MGLCQHHAFVICLQCCDVMSGDSINCTVFKVRVRCVVMTQEVASCLCTSENCSKYAREKWSFDGCRLLPLIIEHTIDERSPLIGHTFDTLMAVRVPFRDFALRIL